MNGPSFVAGCSGAVWSNGAPSEKYCQGAQGKFPWWSTCCYWDAGACREKEGTAVVASTTTQFHDCTDLPTSMNGDSFPRGCSGALWASGEPSKPYCEGKKGTYPWWGACCQWDETSNTCTSKPAPPGGRRLDMVAGNGNASKTILV